MNINLARKLDYYFGIPLCFLLSLLENLRKVIFRKKRKNNPQKIMFIELSEMGSAILAYSSIIKAREFFPSAELYFLIFKKNEESVYVLDVIPKGNVLTVRTDSILGFLADLLRAIYSVRKKKIDTVIDMELFSRLTSIISCLSGADIRVGFDRFTLEGLYRGNLYTHKVAYNAYMHISKNFIALVYALLAPEGELPMVKTSIVGLHTFVPEYTPSQADKDQIKRLLEKENSHITGAGKIVILNPGINEALQIRRWPLEHYFSLAEKLLARQNVFVIFIGIGKNNAIKDEALGKLGDRAINLLGRIDLRQLLALYSISNLLISHDSGATNIASLTEIPVIALFGPETPVLYAPLKENKKIFYLNFACSPCLNAYNHRDSSCKNNKCMQEIKVEEVFLEAEKHI